MFKSNFRIAWRNLVKHKSYAFINIMGLVLSMACGILIFVMVSYHLKFDDFHSNSDRIYRVVTEQHRDVVTYAASVPSPFGKAFRTDYTFAEKTARIATFNGEQVTINYKGEIKKFKEETGVAFTEPEYFEIFNFPLLKGNKKAAITEPNTAILTERMAKKYFGSTDPVGQVITVANKIDFRITGVLKDLPRNTDQKTEVFLSYSNLKDYNEWLASDDAWGGMTSAMQCYVLLKPNVSPAQVEAVLPNYVKKFRAGNKNVHHYKLQPLSELHFDSRYGGVMEKRNLWVLSFIGLFLIITACVNFINLATAQALKRSKEVGIRKVMGGMRAQLFWQFIGETAFITIIAAVMALLLAQLILPVLNGWLGTFMAIDLLQSWELMLFIASLIVTVTFLAGSYPGLILSGFQPMTAIKGKLTAHQLGGLNTRRTLIVTQFTISLVLIIGMIVISKQVQFAKQSSMGFDKDAIVMVPVGEGTGSAVQSLKAKLAQVRGVEKVSLCYEPPSSLANWNTSVRFDNRAEEEPFRTNMKSADDQYLTTFGLQLVAGRNLFPADSARELLINETMVKKLNLQSPADAIGKKISVSNEAAMPIAGVVKDFHDQSFHEDIGAVCIWTNPADYDNYAVKINLAHLSQTLAALEKTWSQAYPDQVYEYGFLDERIAAYYKAEDFMLRIIGVFCFIAILIGCLGLYGLVSFMVAQKTREIGIRKVLGGSVSQLVWIFGREFTRLILLAFLIAAPVAWWLMNGWLQDFEYRISLGAWIFGGALAIISLIAALTVGYQTIRAALSNPVKNLRTE
ncbi:MAG TPA: ABC transporter permease [Chitinophagaceae bacterium]|nr:ABC transporter permease [Chitinophagaceae bacterium]